MVITQFINLLLSSFAVLLNSKFSQLELWRKLELWFEQFKVICELVGFILFGDYNICNLICSQRDRDRNISSLFSNFYFAVTHATKGVCCFNSPRILNTNQIHLIQTKLQGMFAGCTQKSLMSKGYWKVLIYMPSFLMRILCIMLYGLITLSRFEPFNQNKVS